MSYRRNLAETYVHSKKELLKNSTLSIAMRAKALGVARSTLYYVRQKAAKDQALKNAIEETLRKFPFYGFRRVALHLHLNKKKVQRAMKLFSIKASYIPKRRGVRVDTQYPNLIKMIGSQYPHHIWVADFTYLSWRGRTVYFATVMDAYTRDIVGLHVATKHDSSLVIQAICSALHHYPKPDIFHSDNGAEYNSTSFQNILTVRGIRISRSKKGSPWENGRQESFYGKFKIELGNLERFCTLGELTAEAYRTVYIYNTYRIHSALKMSPRRFAQLRALAPQ